MLYNNKLESPVAEKTSFSFMQNIILFFLFLGTMNFVGRYYYFVYFAFLLFCLLCLFNSNTFKFNISFYMLLVLSLCIFIFSPNSTDKITSMIKPFTYPLCYIIGNNILKKSNNELNNKWNLLKLKKIIVILALGPLVHLMLNMAINTETVSRNSIDFWTKDVLSATGQTAMSCMAIGAAYAFIFSKAKLIFKLLSISALLIILYYNLTLAGRTIIIMVVLMAILAFIHLLILSKNRKQLLITVLCVILFILFASYLYNKNAFDIQNSILNSNLHLRFFGKWGQDTFDDKRLLFKELYINKLFDYPFGGSHMRAEIGSYAHDLYLDIYDEAGFIAFISVIIFILISITNLYRCMRNNFISFEYRQLIFCVYTVLYAEFLIEPILQGMPWLFASFCLVDGALSYYLYNTQRSKGNVKALPSHNILEKTNAYC